MSLDLLLSFDPNRPKPGFEIGQFVELVIRRGAPAPRRCMLIRHRRWERPVGCDAFEWVYEGPICEAAENRITTVIGRWRLREQSLGMVIA